MARILRIQFEGAIYHITTRGTGRQEIFHEDRDRQRFLDVLSENVATHHIRLYAYALMPNHFHLLIETPRANLCSFMHQFNSAYTIWFNTKHERTGHLYGGRYKAKLVEGDRYLLALTRYIHLNPVKTKALARKPIDDRRQYLQDFRWSSHRAYADLDHDTNNMLDFSPLAEVLAHGRRSKTAAYRRYVESGLTLDHGELQKAMSQSSKAIGTESFCQQIDQQYRNLVDQQGQPLDAAMRRVEQPSAPEDILHAICREFHVEMPELKKRRCASDARLAAMKLLKDEAGLTQREVALWLGLRDGTTISRKLGEWIDRMKHSPALRRQYEHAKQQVSNKH
jgi:putative transposase